MAGQHITVNDSIGDLLDVDLSSPANGYILEYQTPANKFVLVDPSNVVSGLSLTDLSVGPDGTPSGSGSMTYNNGTGVFTYTPPDLSSYLTSVDLSYTAATRTITNTGGTDAVLTLFDASNDGLVVSPGASTGRYLKDDGTWQTVVGATNLAYTASTRLLESSTGNNVTLPLFTSTEAGLVPLSGGSATEFLSADGTFKDASPLITKGDLYTYDTANAKLPVGGDGQVLVADSGEATGLKWEDKSGAGLTDITITNAELVTADTGLGYHVVTHNLNSDNIIYEVWDVDLNKRIFAEATDRTANDFRLQITSVPTGDYEVIVVGGAAAPSVTPSGTISVSNQSGPDLTPAVTSFDFVGAGVVATNAGNDVTVTIAGGNPLATADQTLTANRTVFGQGLYSMNFNDITQFNIIGAGSTTIDQFAVLTDLFQVGGNGNVLTLDDAGSGIAHLQTSDLMTLTFERLIINEKIGVTPVNNAGKFLQIQDTAGNVDFVDAGTVNKHADDYVFVTSPDTINVPHALNSTDVIVQVKNAAGELIIPDLVDNYTTGGVDVTLATAGTYRVIVTG